MNETDEYVYRATIRQGLHEGEQIHEEWAKESGLRWPSVRRILRKILLKPIIIVKLDRLQCPICNSFEGMAEHYWEGWGYTWSCSKCQIDFVDPGFNKREMKVRSNK